MKKTGILLAGLLVAGNGLAATESNKKIDTLGVNGNKGYITLEGGLSSECKNNKLYVDLKTQPGRITYSTLLATKLANGRFSVIKHSIDEESDRCMIKKVELGSSRELGSDIL